jgi:hypothetical protein
MELVAIDVVHLGQGAPPTTFSTRRLNAILAILAEATRTWIPAERMSGRFRTAVLLLISEQTAADRRTLRCPRGRVKPDRSRAKCPTYGLHIGMERFEPGIPSVVIPGAIVEPPS